MRIVLVVSYYKPAYIYGGPVHSISAMCESLAQLGVHMTVFTTNANGSNRLDVPLNEPIEVNGVEVWYFPLALNGTFYYSPGLGAACTRYMGEFDLAVVECVLAYALRPAALACKRANIPYIVPLRGQLLPWSLRQSYWKKRLYLALVGRHYLNGAAALHCTDRTEAQTVQKLRLKASTFVVPNGINTTHFGREVTRGSLRQRLKIPSDAAVLLFLGRLHPKKRPDIAVATLMATQELSREIHILIVGPDEAQMSIKLQMQAEQLGYGNRIHLLGLLQGDEILHAFADADLFLMPSEPESENFGMSAVEAMAAGLPILVSKGVPVGHWAESAGAGRMAPCTAEAFTQVTGELLACPNQLKEMGRRGQALARKKFDIAIVAQQMLAQYQAIITSGQPLIDV